MNLVMVIIVVEVLARGIFDRPILGVVDMATILLPIFIFLPMANTELLEQHIRVEIFTSKCSPRWQNIFELLALLCGIILLGLYTWQIGEDAIGSFRDAEYHPGLLRLRIYPTKIAIAIGCALFGVQLLIKGMASIRKVFGHSQAAVQAELRESSPDLKDGW